jgi:hypothetical protein
VLRGTAMSQTASAFVSGMPESTLFVEREPVPLALVAIRLPAAVVCALMVSTSMDKWRQAC